MWKPITPNFGNAKSPLDFHVWGNSLFMGSGTFITLMWKQAFQCVHTQWSPNIETYVPSWEHTNVPPTWEHVSNQGTWCSHLGMYISMWERTFPMCYQLWHMWKRSIYVIRLGNMLPLFGEIPCLEHAFSRGNTISSHVGMHILVVGTHNVPQTEIHFPIGGERFPCRNWHSPCISNCHIDSLFGVIQCS